MKSNFNLAEYLLAEHEAHESVAFVFKDKTTTRMTLRTEVSKAARAFRRVGLVEGDRAALLLNDSPDFVVTFLSLLWIGAIPVPVNPKLKHESVRFVLDDSRARYVFVEAEHVTRLAGVFASAPHLLGGVIVRDNLGESLTENEFHVWSLSQLVSGAGYADARGDGCCMKKAESIAFWQYSSGTSGNPKAVLHTQQGMLDNTALFARGVLRLGPEDRIYSAPKMFFGYGLGNSLFFPLLTGATVLLDDRWPTVDTVHENLQNFRPTAFFAVPNLYAALLASNIDPLVLSCVRFFFSAGAALPPYLYEAWLARFGKPILDGIGATEVGHVFLTNSIDESSAGSTGRPVPGYQVRLVDDTGAEVEAGRQGVLLVRGPSVSPGYWEKQEVTSDKFQSGWYRTGDVFVGSEDGRFCYKGREDDLFKVKGRWVVPAEIETLIHQTFPEVREAVLVGVPDAAGLAEPVLFLNAQTSEADDALTRRLLSFLSERLEGHCVPARCVLIKEMPRNDNGKLLRRELVCFALNRPSGAERAVA